MLEVTQGWAVWAWLIKHSGAVGQDIPVEIQTCQLWHYDIMEKLGHALPGCLVTGVVIKEGFVGGLRTNANDCHGIISNCLVVERETSYLIALVRMVVRE